MEINGTPEVLAERIVEVIFGRGVLVASTVDRADVRDAAARVLAAAAPAIRPVEEIRVLRLIEYVGTPEWIASTLAAQGALIPTGTGNWGGRITSAVVPSDLLAQAAALAPSTRPSTEGFDARDTIERQAAEIARMRAVLTDLINNDGGGDPLNWVADAKQALGETA